MYISKVSIECRGNDLNPINYRLDKRKIMVICWIAVLAVVASFYCSLDRIRADEVFTIGFANSSECTFIDSGTFEKVGHNGWLTGDFIKDYLAVGKGERFNPIIAARNARADVHPPLFFYLINCAYSFAPGSTSRIPGHIVTIIFAIIVMTFMYLITKRITGNDYVALLAPTMWILSDAGNTTVTYVRMYVALAAFVLVLIYQTIVFLYDEDTKKRLWWLSAIVAVGSWMHYYFIVFCLVLYIVTMAILLRNKRNKHIIRYNIHMAIGGGVSLLVWPYSVKHLLLSDRGEQVRDNMVSSDVSWYINQLKGYIGTFNEKIFTGGFVAFAGICVILFIALVIMAKISRKENEKIAFFTDKGADAFLIIVASIVGYFLILFKISYSTKWLYISPVFALIDIVIVVCLGYIFSKVDRKIAVPAIILVTVFMGGVFFHRIVLEAMDMQRNYRVYHEEMLDKMKDKDIIYICKEWSPTGDNQFYELTSCDEIYNVDLSHNPSPVWKDIIGGRKTEDSQLIVYISREIENYEDVVREIQLSNDGKNCEMIAYTDYAVYCFDD